MIQNELSATGRGDRTYILGVGINKVPLREVVEIIGSWIETRTRSYVCVTGVHGVMESQKDRTLLDIHNNSSLTVPDGMPLVWISKFRGYHETTRVYGPDLMLAICSLGESKGYRHYFYGGKAGIAEELTRSLQQRFPRVSVAGHYSPPFRPLTEAEDRRAIEAINSTQPDIVWVGLSTPKQEQWMATHRVSLQAPVLIGVGAAFDFLSGHLRQAPRWMMTIGLEWLFRLMMEPKRLWKRYTVNNVLFLYHLSLETLGIKRHT